MTSIRFKKTRGAIPPRSLIIAIGGGKGGVGKSFISSSLSIFFANMGYKTHLIDLDLGAANAHTSLGEPPPRTTLSHFINNPHLGLSDIAIKTKIPNLKLISGYQDNLNIANVSDRSRSRIMSSIHNLNSDITVLDLGTGSHHSTLDFFLMAQKQLVVITPDPSSIENAYSFMRASFYRYIHRIENEFGLSKAINSLIMNPLAHNIKMPSDLLHQISEIDSERGRLLIRKMNDLQFNLILNQARTSKDNQFGESIEILSRKYFGLSSTLIGHLDYDNAVWQCLRNRTHLLLDSPHSRLYTQIMAIARKLAHHRSNKAIA